MAFQAEPYRILAGSLNLLPPTDKAPPEDSLELTNFRVDQAGQLKSRRGITLQSGFLSGERGHTMFRQSPSRRYAGCGSVLYGGDGLNNYASLASGFDGQTLGMESMDGHTWVMNQAKQVKESYSAAAGGGGFTNWLAAPPSSALTAVSGAQAGVTLATFDTAEAWTITDPAGVTTTATHDSAEKILAQSVPIACNPAGTWSADYSTFATKSAAIAGAQQGSDKFRIWVFCSDPAALSSVQILVDVNTKGFDLDYYSVYIPASSLNQGARSWTQVEIFRDVAAVTNQQLSDGIHVFQRAGSTVGKDWSTVSAIRLTVKASDAVDVAFDTFDVIGGLNAGSDGDYTFFVTFDTAEGHESNPSPESELITVDHQGVNLSNIPTSTDPQVTSRHIYMSGGALSEPLRVATIPDNTSTTYLLLTSDDTAQSENATMPIDHDPPPAASGLVWHLGKLIAYDTLDHPGRYFWTPTARPWYFPGAADEEEGNWEDTGEDSDRILKAVSHNRTLIFYKTRSIWRLYGDPDVADPEPTSATIGIFGKQAVCKAGPVDYIAGGEGVYRFDSERETEISVKIRPIFRGEYAILSSTGGVAGDVIPPIDSSPEARANCCLGFLNGRLYFSYPSRNHTLPDVVLVCEIETLRWSQMKMLATPSEYNGAGGFTSFYYEGQDRGLLGMTTTIAGGQVNLLEDPSKGIDNTHEIPLAWLSAYHDQGFPDNPKVYGELVITYQTRNLTEGAASTLTVFLYFNNGQQIVAIGSLNASDRATAVFPLTGVDGLAGYTAKNFAIRIAGNATTECSILDASIYWRMEARNGKTFDSGVTDLGTALAKEVSELELDVTAEAPATLTYYVRSDLPGQAIAQRLTGTIPLTTARANLHKLLASIVDGRKYRLICISTQKFQMHGVRVRMTEIAEFVDGASGEIWRSRVIPIGG